jgi:hypothetical protein
MFEEPEAGSPKFHEYVSSVPEELLVNATGNPAQMEAGVANAAIGKGLTKIVIVSSELEPEQLPSTVYVVVVKGETVMLFAVTLPGDQL